MKKFFSDKKTTACFIIYILITFVIFSSSLSDSSSSTKQSNSFSDGLSSLVSFFTFDSVNLKNDGKTDDYPDQINIVLPKTDDYMVGENFKINYSFEDKRSYPCAQIEYSSSNDNIIKVDGLGNATVLSSGKCTLMTKIKNTNVFSSKSVFVGNKVYEPKFYFVKEGTALSTPINAVVSSSNVGALYNLSLSSDCNFDDVEITCYPENGLDIIANKKDVFFYTKSAGNFEITATITYDNVNGKNQKKSISQTVIVNVDDTLPLPEKPIIDYTITSETINLDILTNENEEINLNYDLVLQNLPQSRFGIVAIKNDSVISVGYPQNADGTINYKKILISPKKVGSSPLILYYLSNLGLNKLAFNVNVKQGAINVASINSPYNYVGINDSLPLTVLGDNKIVSNDSFYWTVSNSSIATIRNGVLYGKKYGTITITAKAKFDESLIISKTLTVRHSYTYIVRKIFGHFLIFLTLSFFAIIVYNKISSICFKKRQKLIGNTLTLIVGFLTALISEILQISFFVYGRTFSGKDVLINFSGFILGFVCFYVILYFINKIKTKKLAKK